MTTIDMKGYATDPDNKWLYPPKNMPPNGVKLHILQEGGVAIHSEWKYGAGYIGWQYLPKRDLEQEAASINYQGTK